MPVIALVGYTNAGKSATMNCLLKKKEVESKDMLFQTLNTTAREYPMLLTQNYTSERQQSQTAGHHRIYQQLAS